MPPHPLLKRLTHLGESRKQFNPLCLVIYNFIFYLSIIENKRRMVDICLLFLYNKLNQNGLVFVNHT